MAEGSLGGVEGRGGGWRRFRASEAHVNPEEIRAGWFAALEAGDILA